MIAVPQEAAWILSALNQGGYEAYVVGGCVRDSLLGKSPQDWDIATSARPEQVKACFGSNSVLETGIRHGTVTLVLGHIPYEITTFRSETAYTDHRRPEKVAFVKMLEEDLKRRDFTINAMAYHPKLGLRDCFGGQEDLKNRLLRTVGDPNARFAEDALRILRAVRFASGLGFTIEGRTGEAILSKAKELSYVSTERKTGELIKLLGGVDAGRVLRQYPEVFCELFPSLTPNSVRLAGEGVEKLPPEPELRLAALFYTGIFSGEIESPVLCGQLLKEQKWSNLVSRSVQTLLSCTEEKVSSDWIGFKRLASRYGVDDLEKSLQLKAAFGEDGETAEKWLKKLRKERPCLSLKDLEITGRDLMQAGNISGKQVGEMLGWLLTEVVEDRLPNRKDALLEAFRVRISHKD